MKPWGVFFSLRLSRLSRARWLVALAAKKGPATALGGVLCGAGPFAVRHDCRGSACVHGPPQSALSWRGRQSTQMRRQTPRNAWRADRPTRERRARRAGQQARPDRRWTVPMICLIKVRAELSVMTSVPLASGTDDQKAMWAFGDFRSLLRFLRPFRRVPVRSRVCA